MDDSTNPGFLNAADIVQLRHEFVTAWSSGKPPSISTFLGRVPDDSREVLVRELVHADIQQRRIRGETPTSQEYVTALQGYESAIESCFSQTLNKDRNNLDATVTDSLLNIDRTPETVGDENDGSFEGRQLGRFELRGLLGEGAYGRVYLAHDPQLDRMVALKVAKTSTFTGRENVEQLMREPRAAARLRHPNIVPTHDAGSIGNQFFIATAYVEGQTLRDRIKSGSAFTPREAAELVTKLANAIHYAHTQGIIHRDLKPANVMVDTTGEPHIMDFGMARMTDTDVLHTQEGVIKGTPAYMSPEQASGISRSIDHRSDQWALGVMLYELLTGERPFGGSQLKLLEDVRSRPARAPRLINRHVPRDLDVICTQCLSKDPGERYATSAALAEDLHRFLRDEPIDARPLSSMARLGRSCRRNPVIAGLTIAVIVVLLSGAIVSTYFAIDASNQSAANLHLAESESAAKEDADAKRQLAEQATRTAKEESAKRERTLYNIQVNRVSQIYKEEPNLALRLLEDKDRCPDHLKDFAWKHLYTQVRESDRRFRNHDSRVEALAVSPSGDLIASAGADGRLVVRGPSDEIVFERDGIRYATLGFSVDGKRLGIKSSKPGVANVLIYDTMTWEVLSSLSSNYSVFEFSPDMQTAAGVQYSRTDEGEIRFRIKIIDLKDGRTLKSFRGPFTSILSLSFSKDGSRLAAAGAQAPIVFDVDVGKVLYQLPPLEEKQRRNVCLSPDGAELCVAGKDWFEIHEIDSGQIQIASTKIATHPVRLTSNRLEYSPDGLFIAFSLTDGVVVFVDSTTGTPRLKLEEAAATKLAFASRQDTITTGSAWGYVRTFRWQDLMGETKLPAVVPTWEADFSRKFHSSKHIATENRASVFSDKHPAFLEIWDLEKRRHQMTLCNEAIVRKIFYPCVDPTGKFVANFWQDPELPTNSHMQIWEITSGRLVAKLKARLNVGGMFSPDGKWLAFFGDRSLEVWDTKTWRLRTRLPLEVETSGFGFSPDSRWLAIGQVKSSVELWDVQTWESKGTLKTVDEEELISGRSDSPIAGEGDAKNPHVMCISFSSKGNRLAWAEYSGHIRIWDYVQQRQLRVMRDPDGELEGLAFSPSDNILATAGKRLRLWDVESGEERANFADDGEVKFVTWLKDSETLVYSVNRGTFLNTNLIYRDSRRLPRVPASDSLTLGTLAHFKFDGTLEDSSIHATKFGVIDATIEGNALRVHGTSDLQISKYFQSDNGYAGCRVPALNRSSFTMAVRLKRDEVSLKTHRALLSAGLYTGWFSLQLSELKQVWVLLNGSKTYFRVDEPTFKSGSWVTLACSVDVPSKKVQLYWDGELVLDEDLPDDFKFTPFQEKDQFQFDKSIGFTNYGLRDTFKGQVDELIIIDRALAPSEMIDLLMDKQ